MEDVLARLLHEDTAEKLTTGGRALIAFFQNSPDPILLFNGKGRVVAKNNRAVDFWNDDEDFLPASIIQDVINVRATGAPFHRSKKNQIIRLETIDGRHYFLPTIFKLLSHTDSKSADGRGNQTIACILKDETAWARSEKIRNNLLSSISHELNTPLTSARVALYLLAEQQIGSLNPNQAEMVDRAKNDLDREIATIQNVLDLMRSEGIEASEPDGEILNLHDLVEEAIVSIQGQSKSLDLNLIRHYSDQIPWVKIEHSTAELVIKQIFSCIVKHVAKGATVDIHTKIKQEHCSLELVTTDPTLIESLPHNLFSLPIESRRMRQLGCIDLGLRVAHEMIKPRGGELTAERSIKTGTLSFRFPIAQQPTP